MFLNTNCSVVLVQFKQPADQSIPRSVRDLGTESQAARALRLKDAESKGPMENVLERNGASLSHVGEKLAEAGFALVDAYAQTRVTPSSEHRGEKPYGLLTFVFRKEPGMELSPVDEFAKLVAQRYEYITVREARDKAEGPMFCLICRTVAQIPVRHRVVEDAAAVDFGIVVSKSIPKKDREEATVAPIKTKKRAQKQHSDDSQLDRLLVAGWTVVSSDDREVKLSRMKDGKPRTMTHYRPRKQARRA